MDQIRKALAWLKQYHFWVLSVLVAIFALLCWYSAAGMLSKQFITNRTAITTEFKNQEELRSKPFHPNDDINKKQLEQIDLQAKNVESIWRTLYERQSKNVLTWPPDLSQEFRDYVTQHKFGDDISRRLRDNYRDYIDRHFESLPKKIGARTMAENELGGMGGGESYMRGGGRGMYRGEGGPAFRYSDEGRMAPGAVVEQDDDYICEWLDQGLVRQELEFLTTPSAMTIWVTQENLWVYHTLLNIIANTNTAANADRMSNAAVRQIFSLQVGQPAAMASLARGRVEILQPPSAGATGMEEGGIAGPEVMGREGMMAEGGGEFMGRGMMAESGRYGFEAGIGGAAMSPEQEKASLLGGRYVDETGKPLGGGMAAGAVPMDGGDPSQAPPPAELPTGPFKRLPIRMELEMDQRWLTHLISECASQPLPVEVTEVRISSSDAGMGGMSGMGGMGGRGESYGYGGAGASGGGSSTYQPPINSSMGGVLTFQQHPNRVTVVIQGIVTIYNEPDPTLLKVDASEQVAVVQ